MKKFNKLYEDILNTTNVVGNEVILENHFDDLVNESILEQHFNGLNEGISSSISDAIKKVASKSMGI